MKASSHQCYITENTKNQLITEMQQRWARNKWNARANENQLLDSGGPDQRQSIKYQSTLPKIKFQVSLYAGIIIESEA